MATLEPVAPDFLDTAPFRIVKEVAVMAPIEACWSLIADQASWVQWFDEMSAVEATPWTWTDAGQTRVVTVNGMKISEVAISVIPNREYAFTIVKWPLPTAVRAAEGIRLEDRTNGGSPRTVLTYIGAFESTSVGRYAEKRLTKQMGDTWTTALKKLGEFAAAKAATSAATNGATA